MKRIFTPILLASAITIGFAQNGQEWFHGSIDYGFYGVNTDKAYEYLKNQNKKPQNIIVGVLDSGVEADHEDLKAIMWTNKKEIAGNGIDDDKNGYIDDIHGWNFLGNPNGQNVAEDNLELVRLYKEYTPLFEGKSQAQIKKNIKKNKKKYEIYKTAKDKIAEKKIDAEQKGGRYKNIKEFLLTAFNHAEPILGNTSYTAIALSNKIAAAKDPKLDIMNQLFGDYFKSTNQSSATLKEVKENNIEGLDEGIKYYENQAKYNYNPDLDTRKIVGDDYANKKEKYYGNNDVEGPDAMHGTHVAGVIAAQRNNNKGINGIADAAQIMSVRVVPDGDERDKDVANGIYYAVDNGAKIINMSFGKSYSPEKNIVDQAIKYAEKNGVLMFHAAGNDAKNVDVEDNFPSNFTDGKLITTNWITVGASTQKGNPELPASFSNYGKKTVDLFSPGVSIYSTVTDNKYKNLQGTSMASPIAAGVAALVWSYYPELTMSELRTILLKSVNVYNGVVVVPNESDNIISDKPFTDLSVTGGVIDAYLAVKNADEYIKNKKK